MPGKIVCIMGPTASGKTRLGVMLAERFNGEVVSADSMQIYRGMDIGTAKPTAEEMRGIPHHMIDVADPSENYSAARYAEEASKVVDDILGRGRLPFVVGGTGLYIDALIQGREYAAFSGETRERLNRELEALGPEAMHEKLRLVDPAGAERLHPNDTKRVIRALEVWEETGETITEHDRKSRELPPRYDALIICLDYSDRADLYARIDARVDEMVRAGLFDEVRRLVSSGLDSSCTAMQAIGYKEAVRALSGELTEDEAAALIRQESRRNAKRQLSWIRRLDKAQHIVWEKTPDFDRACQTSTDFMLEAGVI